MSVEAARRLVLARRPDLAERELRRWLALHPDDAHGHALQGWSLALQKRPGAVEEAEEAVRLAPEWAYTHATLGEVCVEIGHSWRAEMPLRRALALDPHDPQHYSMLALALTNQRGRFRSIEALRLTEWGLALNPGHAGCARIRALTLLNLLRFREARAAAEVAQRLDPENSYGHAIAGWAHLFHRGSGKRSRELLREALRSDPENEYARRGLRHADQWVIFAAALVLETEAPPWWLRLAPPLHALSVAAGASHGADVISPLVVSLVVLGCLELWTLPVRRTALNRARMVELRVPGAVPRAERVQVRVLLACLLALAILLPLVVFLP